MQQEIIKPKRLGKQVLVDSDQMIVSINTLLTRITDLPKEYSALRSEAHALYHSKRPAVEIRSKLDMMDKRIARFAKPAIVPAGFDQISVHPSSGVRVDAYGNESAYLQPMVNLWLNKDAVIAYSWVQFPSNVRGEEYDARKAFLHCMEILASPYEDGRARVQLNDDQLTFAPLERLAELQAQVSDLERYLRKELPDLGKRLHELTHLREDALRAQRLLERPEFERYKNEFTGIINGQVEKAQQNYRCSLLDALGKYAH